MTVLPNELLSCILQHTLQRYWLTLRLLCQGAQSSIAHHSLTQASQLLQNSYYHEYALRHCPLAHYKNIMQHSLTPTTALCTVLLFCCQGCGRVPSAGNLFFVDSELGGIGCVGCCQQGMPLQLVGQEEALLLGLQVKDIRFLSPERGLRLEQSEPLARLKDLLQLQLRLEDDSCYIAKTVEQRKELLLDRGRQLGVPGSILSHLQSRRRIVHGPEWQFASPRNLDNLLCAYSSDYYRDAIQMYVSMYYYQQTDVDRFLTQMQLAYHGLCQKLQLERSNASWVSEQLFLPKLKHAMGECLQMLDGAGLCPLHCPHPARERCAW